MKPDESHEGARLSRIWDELLSGKPSTDAEDVDMLAEIRRLEQATGIPAASHDMKSRLWADLMNQAAPPQVITTSIPLSSNGHLPGHVVPDRTTRARKASFAWFSVYRLLAIGALSGFGAGFVTGIWTRIAMRFAGMLTIDRNRGFLTESESVVGRMTLDGTLFLAIFAGMIGVVGGVLYVAIRYWLPRNAWLRAFGYGGLLLGVFGFFVMEPDNGDYRLFGPAWFNISTFSIAYLICGALISVFADRLDRLIPRVATVRPFRWHSLAWIGGLAPFAAMGLIGALSGLSLLGEDGAARYILAPLLVALTWQLGNRWLPRASLHARSSQLVGYFAFIAPCAVGFFLTMRAIVLILSG
jgi:hypothetical protein